MIEYLQYLSRHCPVPISVFPNAGLPKLVKGETVFPLTPVEMADQLARIVADNGISVVGGCCGTTPEHIKAIVEKIGPGAAASRWPEPIAAVSSLYQAVEYRQENSLLNVGERCNASGSRRFRELLEQENWDEMVSIARQQMREGSHVIDVNVDYAGRDNAADMAHLVGLLVRQVDAPLMLDSTQPDTIEAGLKKAGGKCLINSANLEDG
jgi:5-methyltetrahydrofolate--homocysteine methyltransferase